MGQSISRMSLQFILDTNFRSFIDLKNLAKCHCVLYGQYLSPYFQNIFFSAFSQLVYEWKGPTSFLFSSKSWTLYLNNEQTAEGYQSTNKYFFVYRHTSLLVLFKVPPPKISNFWLCSFSLLKPWTICSYLCLLGSK